MVEFEFTDPSKGFLIGMELLDGYTEDDGERTEVLIFSIGFLFFRVNYLVFK